MVDKGVKLRVQAKVNAHRKWRKDHLKAQQGCCKFCHNKISFEASVLTRLKKLSEGGEDTFQNSAATCKKCNKGQQ